MVNSHQKLLDSPEFKASVELAKEVLRSGEEMADLINEPFRVSMSCECPYQMEPPAGRPGIDRPEIVTLCGSTKFKEQYEEAQMKLTLQNKVVISVGLFGHKIGLDMTGPVKKMLDELHLRKIDMSDTVMIINVGRYIGSSTKKEIEYAKAHGKRIIYLEPMGDEDEQEQKT